MTEEEKFLSEAYDRGEVLVSDPTPELLETLADAGNQTFKKDRRINIRLSSHDLLGIQRKAARKGIPYQAFIAGLIHQYVQGDLREVRQENQPGNLAETAAPSR